MNNNPEKDRTFSRDITNIVIGEIPIQLSMEAKTKEFSPMTRSYYASPELSNFFKIL